MKVNPPQTHFISDCGIPDPNIDYIGSLVGSNETIPLFGNETFSVSITYNGTTPGSVAVVQCDAGYFVDGEDTLTCQDTGMWTPQTVTCMLVGQCKTIQFLVLVKILKQYQNYNTIVSWYIVKIE